MINTSFFAKLTERIRNIFKVRTNQIYLVVALAVVIVAGIGALLLNRPGPTATPTSTAVELTAIVKEIQGDVAIKQPGQTDFSPASLGEVLQYQGLVQTAASSTARLDLTSGTIIRVAPSSIFELEKNEQTPTGLTTTLTLTIGQLFIILKGGSLDISVPSGVASVRGSYMSALIYPSSGKVFVECLEGHCDAINNTGDLQLTDGQKGIFVYEGDGMDALPLLTPMTHNDYLSWLAISPESKSIVDQSGNGSGGGGKTSPSCPPSHTGGCP